MRVYRRSGRWWVALPGGARKSLKLPKDATKRQATRKAALLFAEAQAPLQPVQVAASFVPLSALTKIWLDLAEGKGRKASTLALYRRQYKHYIKPWWGDDRDVREMTALDVERWQADLARRRAPSTVNNVLVQLRSILAVGVRGQHLTSNVAKDVRPLKAKQDAWDWYTAEESALFLQACKKHSPRWAPMFVVFLRTGLRRSELRGMKWEDVDFAGARIHVRRQYTRHGWTTPKSGEARIVPLSSQALAALREQRAWTALRGDLVFASPHGGPLSEDVPARRLKKVAALAGLRSIRVHDLRHSFAAQLVSAGVPLLNVSKLMGHSSTVVTQLYAHLAPKVLEDTVALLDGPQAGTKVVQKSK